MDRLPIEIQEQILQEVDLAISKREQESLEKERNEKAKADAN